MILTPDEWHSIYLAEEQERENARRLELVRAAWANGRPARRPSSLNVRLARARAQLQKLLPRVRQPDATASSSGWRPAGGPVEPVCCTPA